MNAAARLRLRPWAPWLLGVVLAGLALAAPPLAQPLWYHAFADQRACGGVPRCLDTLSNGLFVLAGAAGFVALRRASGSGRLADPREALPYRLFFGAIVVLGFASSYYHLDPGNARLVGDRLAMMVAFMAWLGALVCERAGCRAGLMALPVLLVAGIGSTLWWGVTEAQGAGDLRPYLAMQAYAMLLIPLLLWLYPPRYSGDGAVLGVLGLYVLALLGDFGDRAVYALTDGLVGGHTLKHALAALAVVVVALRLVRRRAL